ncbi:histone-lysine N-methyltransferase SUV39H2-like [Bradysia coprophila]|uniref:histone-lysine N-methyltransferase SUV39H2-like n=1 Tax=Bradysia coprophila TaxID=38358 RepID=UPI00187DC8A4|nr:histone-lysine N-methyltransferase SUV39H2-like [Bradysia coprophila]
MCDIGTSTFARNTRSTKMSSRKRKCLDVEEVEIKIKTQKYSEKVNLSSTVTNECMESNYETVKLDDIKENNGYTSHNHQSMSYRSTVKLMQSALTKNLVVDALEPIPVLKEKCVRLGINGNFDFPQCADQTVNPKCHGEYEVEQILDHDTEKHLYFVKWKGYGTESNTWEPSDHLTNVSHLTYNFRLMERSLSRVEQIAYKKLVWLSCLLDELISSSNEDPYVLLKLSGKKVTTVCKQNYFHTLKSQLKVKRALVQRILIEDETFQVNYCNLLKVAMTDIGITKAFQSVENFNNAIIERKKFVKCLKTWESNINRLILEEEGRESATIVIENIVDLDSPFEDFTYITKSILEADVSISEEPLLYCDCNDCGSNPKKCCSGLNESSFAYNDRGSLKSKKSTTIFECNSKCKCASTCPNRVIQNGRKFQLVIFKTADDRGWGVKALEPIPQGKFIVEYVGEIITDREAQRRAASGQNPFHKSYLFDMDCEIATSCDYVIDGAKFGNVSRFINHSCSPNMEVYPFWIGNPDKKMPRLAFFSDKCIGAGEELTFDYRMSAPEPQHKPKTHTPPIRVPCKCGSKKCRKFLF